MASEKELDRALESAICDNAAFRVWFLRRTQSGSSFPNCVWSRADHPWSKVRLVLPNPVTGALEAVEREGEGAEREAALTEMVGYIASEGSRPSAGRRGAPRSVSS